MLTRDRCVPTTWENLWLGPILKSLLIHICVISLCWMTFRAQPKLQPFKESISVKLINLKAVQPVEKSVNRPEVAPPKPMIPTPVKPGPEKKTPAKPVRKKAPAQTRKVIEPAIMTKQPIKKSEPVQQAEPLITSTADLPRPVADALPERDVVSSGSVSRQPAKVVEDAPEPEFLQNRQVAIRNSYLAILKRQIEHHKQYPLIARKGRQQGTVIVQFELTADGNLKSCQVQKSCGYRLLDKAAARAVRAAAPFPDLPAEIDLADTSFILPIKFVLNR